MSRIFSYTFPACNIEDVCKIQALTGAGNLILNGNLSNQITGEVSFIDNGYSRSISITSNQNLTGVNFTINGTQNGVAVSQTVAGPNNTTVYYNPDYDVITSISSGAAAANVAIGSGLKGFISLIKLNLNKDILNYSLSMYAGSGNNVKASSAYVTYENISNNGRTFLSNINTNLALFELKEAGEEDQWELETPLIYHSILIYIDGNAATSGSSMTINFIQL
jgi:hypothetical protein